MMNSKNRRRRYSREERDAIMSMHKIGLKYQDIAKHFNVSAKAICHVVAVESGREKREGDHKAVIPQKNQMRMEMPELKRSFNLSFEYRTKTEKIKRIVNALIDASMETEE